MPFPENPYPGTHFAQYRHRQCYMDSNVDQHQFLPEMSPDTVALFRYVGEKFRGPNKEYSWWSEYETAWSDAAGEATGIGSNSCRYRIEWHCPIKTAIENIHVGNRRMCAAGNFLEYLVKIEVPENQMKWHTMNDWGPFRR